MSKKPVVNNNPAQYPNVDQSGASEFPASGTQVYGSYTLPDRITTPSGRKSRETSPVGGEPL